MRQTGPNGPTGTRILRAGLVRYIFFVAMFVLSAAAINVSVGHAQQFRFSTIKVEGNLRIESSTVLNYAGIPTEQRVTAADLNAAYQSVSSSGLFEEVELLPSGSRLVIKVKEFPTINRVAFEGNVRLNDDVLVGLIKSQVRKV